MVLAVIKILFFIAEIFAGMDNKNVYAHQIKELRNEILRKEEK